MSHAYVDVRVHIIFSTRDRLRYAPEKMRKLRGYIAGIAKNLGAEVNSVGGAEDHVHLLVGLPATISVSEFVQKVKGNSSKWYGETFPSDGFAWQQGYSAFSVSHSQLPVVLEYVMNQDQHHARRDFAAEYRALLAKHGVKIDSHDTSV